MQTVAGQRIVDIEAGILNRISCRSDDLHGAALKLLMGNAFVTDLEIFQMFRNAQPVKIKQAGQRLLVGDREEHLSVDRSGDPLGMGPVLILKRIDRYIGRVFADQSLKVGLDGIRTVSVRIIPVVDECSDIAGLHHIVLGGVARGVKGEIFPHKAFVVPGVQKFNGVSHTIFGKLSVIKSVYIEFLVGHLRIQEGFDQGGCSPAYVIADGERNHLVRIVAEQCLRVVTESAEHIVELFLCGRSFQSQLVQPVSADKTVGAVLVGELGLDVIQLSGRRILVPVNIGLGQPVPEIREIILVGLHQFAHVAHAAHGRIGLDSGQVIGYAEIRSSSGRQQVVDLLDLCPSGNSNKFNLYIVILKHTLLDVLGIHVVGHVGSAVYSAVVNFNGNVFRLREFAVGQFLRLSAYRKCRYCKRC